MTLREQVAQAIEAERFRYEHPKGGDPVVVVYAPDAAAASIGVVAAALAEQIEALPTFADYFGGGACVVPDDEPAGAYLSRDEVLALVRGVGGVA